MNFGFGNGTLYVNVVQSAPRCFKCLAIAQVRANGALWCQTCLDAENQRQAIANARTWIAAAFFAVDRAQRPRLYKQLAVVFHPDQGGNPDLMIALNAVRDQLG